MTLDRDAPDRARPAAEKSGITEVHVDAGTGAILKVDEEG